MMENPPIRLVNVHKSFRGGRDHILKGISIDFPLGKLSYILGPSGTGKSVTIKHILGLLKPDSGEVWVRGKNYTKLRGNELAQERHIFGMLFQNAALFDDMTVLENVAFPLYEHTSLSDEEIYERSTKALSNLGMNGGFDKYPNELSGGMRKRVGLARAIVREPSILLYDEPTTGLDPVTRTTVDDLIAHLKSKLKLTSVVISHDVPAALELADQIIFLFDGHAIFKGTPSEFCRADHPTIQNFLKAEHRSARVLLKHSAETGAS